MKKIVAFLLPILLLMGSTQVRAQNKPDEDLVQFSGVILTADSIKAIPYVYITIPGTMKGAISDLNGFFSFVAHKGDTVLFQSVGYKNSTFVIPDTLSSYLYSMVKLMSTDTFYIDKAVIQRLPSRQYFDYYFVKADIPDNDLDRARKNLEREELKERAELMGPDGVEASKRYLNQEAQKSYYAGQLPPMQIFNPIAWAKFFEAWKRGDFKKKE